ncbi:SIMPL domain-containing protein [Microbacterium ulmi]|uniref:SIMPL domain-containing protein n=1 Tax=Microbacterium ulmi TaxID=179095 RepID=A0A7Y2Q0H8_9MICO|nr:hypothetical protein [Microbacterium ulmi]NNH02638.1 SIMPL domain-containing protein [Microbacterium ulmi]
MSEVIITVRGEHETRIAPEEATVRLTVRAEGPERGAVVERIVGLSEPLRDDLAVRKAQGAVREWSSQSVSVWANRPWNDQGRQLALVHYASVELSATFTDFGALSLWITDAAARDGVQIDAVSWQLTPATRKATEADVAARAVSVAVDRANAYAAAIGLSTVTALEIADLGLLTDGGQPGPVPLARAAKAMMFATADAGAGPSMELHPEDILVTAGVEARFSAR